MAVLEPGYAKLWTEQLGAVITLRIDRMPSSFAFTTGDGRRIDIVQETVADLATTPYRHRITVLDRDDLAGLIPPAEPEAGPDLTAMGRLITEFLRQSAIFPTAVVGRQDWLLGQEAVHNYRQMLYLPLVEANRPLPALGLKQWSAVLTPAQRRLLANLPVPSADRDSVPVAMAQTRHALRTAGRTACERCGGTWPTDVDDAWTQSWRAHGLADQPQERWTRGVVE